MQKLTYGAGALVVLVLTFSLGMRVGSQPKVTGTDGSGRYGFVEAGAGLSPLDMMTRHDRTLTAEKHNDPF